MMTQRNLSIIAKFMPRLYVAVFLIGAYAGFSGAIGFNLELTDFGNSIKRTLTFPAYGVLLGTLWLGIGPIGALFFSGFKDGLTIRAYLMAGGSVYFKDAYVTEGVASQILNLAVGLMESLSLIYASTAGMYLAIYAIEVYRSGLWAESVYRTNFTRRMAGGLFLAAIAIGLRLAL